MVADGAMLLATDALSVERTLGSYMLSSCDLAQSQQAEFSRLHGSSEYLLDYATTYDDNADQLLKEHVSDVPLQHNITEDQLLKQHVLDVPLQHNITDDQLLKQHVLHVALHHNIIEDQLLKQHVLDVPLQHNITEFRDLIQDEEFAETCANFTTAERTALTVEFGEDMEQYILAIDDVRQGHIIPSILQVNWTYFFI